jgi:hypothetical protein
MYLLLRRGLLDIYYIYITNVIYKRRARIGFSGTYHGKAWRTKFFLAMSTIYCFLHKYVNFEKSKHKKITMIRFKYLRSIL